MEDQTVESLPQEWAYTQITRKKCVKGHDTLATTTFPLTPSFLDSTPASRDETFSGPEWDLLGTPWAHAEGPDLLSTSVVGPLQHHVP